MYIALVCISRHYVFPLINLSFRIVVVKASLSILGRLEMGTIFSC